jgi:hypothetical protein
MYAGGDSVIKSVDGGNTWNLVGPNPLDNQNIILSIGVSSTNKDSLYVGTAPTQTTSHIFRSANGGTSFTNVTGGNLPNRYPRRITVDPINSQIVYIVYSGFGTGHVFKSTNAGGTWTDISASLPDIPFHCLAVDPQDHNTIFAGCDLGIFYSNDGGLTWNTFNTGFPEAVMIFDLTVSPADNTLLAFSHGHGVYKRSLADAVGVNEALHTDVKFLVYPNPNHGEFSIQSSEVIMSAEIYNIKGEKVFSKNPNSRSETLKLNEASGLYFVKLKTDKGCAARKIIVNK